MNGGLIVGVIALSVTAGCCSAYAADMRLPPRPGAVPVIVPQAWSWTGFYIGGNLGGVFGHASGTSDFLDTSFAVGDPEASNPQHNSFSTSGFLGGFQAGYNWQISQWVVGIEGDWDWAGNRYSFCRQTDIFSTPCVDNGDGFESIESKLNWLATIRGRFGYLVTPWLLAYGTAGGAWGNVETTLSQSCLNDGCGGSSTLTLATSQSTTTTKGGWVAGAGLEAMLTPGWLPTFTSGGHWMLRGEWLHVDLGTLSNALTTVGNTGGAQTTVWSRSERFDEFRAALSYKF